MIIIVENKKHEAYEVLVDDEDSFLVSHYNWYVRPISGMLRVQGRLKGKRGKLIYMSRLVMGEIDPAVMIDHRDHDTLNNQKYNLRRSTNSQNQANSFKPVHNTSGYKGVSYYKRIKKWTARIMKDKKSLHLGYFNTPEEAYKAYCGKAKELNNKFACIMKNL